MPTKPKKKSVSNKSVPTPYLSTLPVALDPARNRSTERVQLFGNPDPKASLLIVFRGTTQTTGLFQSISGSSGTVAVTDSFDFAGENRYFIRSKKLRGILRKVLEGVLRPEACNRKSACGKCQFCDLFGFFDTNGNSRVEVQDLWSIQARSAPFMITSRSVDPDNPLRFDVEMVPPGVEFLGMMRILQPSQTDVANILAGLELAGLHGIGSKTKDCGKIHFEPLAIFGGTWPKMYSPEPLLRQLSLGSTLEQVLLKFTVEQARGSVDSPNFVIDSDLDEQVQQIMRRSPLSPTWGGSETMTMIEVEV